MTLNDRVNSAVGLVAGRTYQATAWVRTEKAGQGVILRILEQDAAYKVVSSKQSYQWRTDTAWKKITTTHTATRSSTSLDVNVVGSGLTPGSAIVVDDVAVVDTTVAQPSPTPTAVAAPTGWNLVWADEFNGTSINRDRWNVDNNSTYGDGNNELACLMDRPENVKVSGGLLTITARKEATPLKCKDNDTRFPGGRSYTSGMLTTKNKADFEYGRFEISAKTPLAQGTSKGLWPAFWLRPATGGIGELDILEAIGTGKGDPFSANHVVQTIHYDYVGTHKKQGAGYDLPVGTTADGFHNYAVEWAPGSIKWFVDDVQTYERTLSTTSWIDQAFVKKFYIRLNMAVGGNWPGSPTAETVFPAEFQVDYVRVYQR
ncbi:MAG: glycoside hydrolase family 16 protein [Cryobacterium sp.]